MSGYAERIDVVVCAHNEVEHLPRLFASFGRQTVSKDRFRVVLVDNASTDDTARQVPRIAEKFQVAVTYVYEPDLAYSSAMNAGFRAATTEYVAHTDAHCWVEPDWIEQIARGIDRYRPDALGGPYYSFSLGEPPTWFRYDRMDHGAARRRLGTREFLSGANLVWRRAVVERLGGFSVVGLVGRGMLRGDETNLLVRLRRDDPDALVVYDPAIVVHHLTRAELTSLRYCAAQAFAHGRNHVPVHGATERRALPMPLELAVRSLFVACAGVGCLTFRNRSRYPYWQNYWYERLLPQFYRLGELVEHLHRGGVRVSPLPRALPHGGVDA